MDRADSKTERQVKNVFNVQNDKTSELSFLASEMLTGKRPSPEKFMN